MRATPALELGLPLSPLFFVSQPLLLAIKNGELTITRSDRITFAARLSAIPLWYYTQEPLITAIIATIIDGLAYYPTFRKSYAKPQEEMIFSYVTSNAKHVASLFAMAEHSMTTLIYPTTLCIMNTALVIMLVWRRMNLTLYTGRH